jgi:hypothetical protein
MDLKFFIEVELSDAGSASRDTIAKMNEIFGAVSEDLKLP